ncbi:MAG TPA: diguanylate cyclase, partial [Burkholderiales bacterium]|nr:diguanylate cyclase [Burkholderiales bacterium]
MSALKLVIVEDSQDDADLLLIMLTEAGLKPQWLRVENEIDYLAALETNPDLVLCDYGLPQFSTRRALELLRARSPDIPFIIVSGHIGDDVAVAMLKAGANDYVLKDNLARMAPAVQRELREAEARRRQHRLEEALRIVAEALSGVTGRAFLESLVVQVTRVIGADYVFIGELSGPDKKIVQTVAVCAKDRITNNFGYTLEETPAAGQIFSGNRDTEPAFPLLGELALQSYMGTPLVSSAGATLGLMVVMHGAPIENTQVAESLMRIYAVRAASELERMAQTAALEFQATHDSLTSLCNRHALQSHMAAMLKEGPAHPRGALLLIDLDRFKEINDTLGHPSGDEILKQIGPRLLPLLKSEQLLCRLGGDEFAVLVSNSADREEIEELAKTLWYAIREPFEIAGIRLRIGASIGISLYPEHSRDGNELLRQADVAMYWAKNESSGHRIYEPGLDMHTPDRLMLMNDLRRAIENDELVLHYQPKIDLVKQDGISLEALVRWQHPERGLLPPGKFVPLAEMTDLIRDLTLRVIDVASSQCRLWRDAGYRANVAVNISVRNLLD